MIKDLIQNKFTAAGTALISPTNGGSRNATKDLKSILSDRGDPKMNSERLRLMLPRIKYPQYYNEREYVL